MRPRRATDHTDRHPNTDCRLHGRRHPVKMKVRPQADPRTVGQPMQEPRDTSPDAALKAAPPSPRTDTPAPESSFSQVETSFSFDPISRTPSGHDPEIVADDLLVGGVVGDVVIERFIAAGGMGRVYLGRQQQPARPVAVKFMRHVRDPAMVGRFRREVDLLGRLSHPNVARIFTAGTHRIGVDVVPYYVMEYIANAEPLVAHCRRRGLTAEARIRMFLGACDAVAAGHALGIVHRDLKPSNMLVSNAVPPSRHDGAATVQVKVIDFGIAKAVHDDPDADFTRTGDFVGTLAYMSPEQLADTAAEIDARSDIYSLGVVLYELLSGRLPRETRRRPLRHAVRPEVEAAWRPLVIDAATTGRRVRRQIGAVVATCLERRPADRYATAGALADDLRRLLAGEAVAARSWRTAARRNRRQGLIVLGGATAAAAAAILGIRRQPSVRQTHGEYLPGGFVSPPRSSTRASPLEWLRLDFAEPPAAPLTPANFFLVRNGVAVDVSGLTIERRDDQGRSWIVRGLEPLNSEQGSYSLELLQDESRVPRSISGRRFAGQFFVRWYMPPYRAFRFDLLDDSWDDHVVSMEGVGRCEERMNLVRLAGKEPVRHTFIRPTTAGRPGRIVMAFEVEFPIRAATLATVLAVWTSGDPDPRDAGASAALDVSPDGERWTNVASLGPGHGGFWTGPTDILPIVEGGTAVWIQARLEGTVRVGRDGVKYAQFMRTSSLRLGPTFRLDLTGPHAAPTTMPLTDRIMPS